MQLAKSKVALHAMETHMGLVKVLRLLLVPVRELALLSWVRLDDRSGQRVPILQSIQYDTVSDSNTFGTFGRNCLQSVFDKCG